MKKNKTPKLEVPLWYKDSAVSFAKEVGFKKVGPNSPIGFDAFRFDSSEEAYAAYKFAHTAMAAAASIGLDRTTCTVVVVYDEGDSKYWHDCHCDQQKPTRTAMAQRINLLENSIKSLLEWEAQQGGYEAPAWKHAKKVVQG